MQQPTSNRFDEIKAGVFSLAVHAGLISLLFFSLNWKTAEVSPVAEVTLWESLPQTAPPPPAPEPPPPVEEIKPEPEVKPEPPVKVQAPEQSDIVLEKKREEEKQKKLAEAEKKAKAQEQKKMLAALKNEISKEAPEDNSQQEALKKLQQEALADENALNAQQASAAAAKNTGEVNAYVAKIKNKIRGNVNKTLCGNGNPELKFEIGLLPTGELTGVPKLTKSSGNDACDEAVERAIMASEPLPVPPDAGLFSNFRNLKLTFKPNE